MARLVGPNRPGESGWREFFIRAAPFMPKPVTAAPFGLGIDTGRAPQAPEPAPAPAPRTRVVERTVEMARPAYADYLRESSSVPGVLVMAAGALMRSSVDVFIGTLFILGGIVWALWRAVDNPRMYGLGDLIMAVLIYGAATLGPFGLVIAPALTFGWSLYQHRKPRFEVVEETITLPAPAQPPRPPKPYRPSYHPPKVDPAETRRARERQFEALRAQVRTNGYPGAKAFLGESTPHEVTRLGVGAAAEERIGHALESLPDDFEVAHDLAVVKNGKTRANIDHLVSGPTGVVLVDAKSWAGGTSLHRGELTDRDMRERARHDRACAKSAGTRAAVRNRAVKTLRWISTNLPAGYPVTVVIGVDGEVDGGALVVRHRGEPDVHIVEGHLLRGYITALPERRAPDLGAYLSSAPALRFESPDNDAGWSAR